MIVHDLTLGTTLGNLGYTKFDFPKPVFHGDTLRAESTIMDKRESKSRTDSGIVFFEHRGLNQRDELVHIAHRAGLMLLRPRRVGGPGYCQVISRSIASGYLRSAWERYSSMWVRIHRSASSASPFRIASRISVWVRSTACRRRTEYSMPWAAPLRSIDPTMTSMRKPNSELPDAQAMVSWKRSLDVDVLDVRFHVGHALLRARPSAPA